jgi:acylphosphatase
VVDTATRLGLVGWVRNADDERAVELVAEGEAAPLETLASQLDHGPGAAWVERVEASRGPASGGMTRFEIRR